MMLRKRDKEKIVITGGAGFIGSHVVQLFCDTGYDVYVIDDLSFGFEKFIDPRSHFVKARIQDEKILDKVLPGSSAVIHLAASSIIKLSFDSPSEYFENNIIGGVKLLESMRKNGIKKIIFSSSAAVYGEPKKIPISENDEKHPSNPYGASKLAFEHILEAYYRSFGLESVSLRYFNVYGPRDEQIPQTRAIPIWIKSILLGKPVPLYWEGKQKRDYIYVSDAAEAHLKAIELSGIHFINIGSGCTVVMKDLLKLLEELTEKRVLVKKMGERFGDPQLLVTDIDLAKRLLKWKPKVSLEDGLKKTIKYYKDSM